MTAVQSAPPITGYIPGTWTIDTDPLRDRVQRPPPHGEQGQGRVPRLLRHLRDRREPLRLERRGDGGPVVGRHRQRRPRRAPPFGRLLRHRPAHAADLQVDRHPVRRRGGLRGRRRAHPSRGDQAGTARARDPRVPAGHALRRHPHRASPPPGRSTGATSASRSTWRSRAAASASATRCRSRWRSRRSCRPSRRPKQSSWRRLRRGSPTGA